MKEAATGYISHGVGTITGLDYWTHPNCKIQLVQCRIEAKLSVTSLTLLPTASFLEFLEIKGHVHIQ